MAYWKPTLPSDSRTSEQMVGESQRQDGLFPVLLLVVLSFSVLPFAISELCFSQLVLNAVLLLLSRESVCELPLPCPSVTLTSSRVPHYKGVYFAMSGNRIILCFACRDPRNRLFCFSPDLISDCS